MWTLSPGVPIGCRSPRKRGPYSMPKHRHTASASAEILSVEQAAGRSATAFDEIADLTARVSSHADDLDSKVAAFFSRVRAG